ncbi:hypothetical protein SAMN04487996_111354 [Dyadobacter soli]|uniref:Uncharacterized protein n=1 Tax=Dyadobacter soli TaxID=659014 RepID=A0A1G7MRJ2_9BACT|nr:hypothetical protein SAMN04487996_111354 [Dyadobacter soli]
MFPRWNSGRVLTKALSVVAYEVTNTSDTPIPGLLLEMERILKNAC